MFKFIYSLKFIQPTPPPPPQISTYGPFAIICRHLQAGKNFDLLHVHIPSWGEQAAISSGCRSETVNNCLFSRSILCHVFHIFVFFFFFFRWFHCLKYPSSVVQKGCLMFSRERKPWYILQETVWLLDKLYPGTSYSAIGHEFIVNEPTTYIT